MEIIDFGVRVPERVLLAPLRKVQACSFEVVLPWPMGLETSGELEDAGFVVKRPPESVNLMIEMNVDKANCGVRRNRGIWGRLSK